MKEVQIPAVLPRWYQDLSIPQMQNVFALGDIMRVDYAERVTGRTQRALGDIGVTSTFVKITAEQIKKIRRLTDLDPVKFLCEIYRMITGQSFVDEEYKKVYDCNERIILSAIAFLTLPETVIELHRRIPMGDAPKLPPKPVPERIPRRKRAESPYLEPPFARPYWLTYRQELDNWRKQCQKIAVPRVIMPPSLEHSRIRDAPTTVVTVEELGAGSEEKLESYQEEITDKKKDNSSRVPRIGSKSQVIQEEKFVDKHRETLKQSSNFSTLGQAEFKAFEENGKNRDDYSKLKNTSKKPPDFKTLPDNVKNSYDYSQEKYSTKKSWLGEKDTQLIIAGSTAINENSPDHPISLETSGIACVTPDNSDENFFAALSHDDAIGKSYPRGRENLSRKWQEWLHDAEEDFKEVEKQANTILSSVAKTLKLMGPEPACDSCCACRQTRKAYDKFHNTKTPHIVIDSVALDGNRNKYVVGSLAMNSPAPSPSESTENLPDVIASHEKIIKSRIVNGVTDDMGVTTYYVTGVSSHVEHVPRKTVSYATLPKPIKNVPPCGCAIEKTINDGLTIVPSDDNIKWTKSRQLCIGKKYRPQAGGASSCREYPNDKSCRRNPFKKIVVENVKAALRAKDDAGKDYYPSEKRNMYSIADFRPCGDEDGMAVCGGPWGAVNIPDEEELARRAAEEKLILESPPCGDKAGRAICGAPFGTRHPIPKKPKKDDEDEEEEAEVDEEELEERKKRDRKSKIKIQEESKIEKFRNRDPGCSTNSGRNFTADKLARNAAGSSERKFSPAKTRKSKKGKILKADEKAPEADYDSKAKTRNSLESSLSLKSSAKSKRIEKDERGNEDTEIIARKRKVKEIKNQWKKLKRMSTKFVPSPAMLPEQATFCKREDSPSCCQDSSGDSAAGEESAKNEGAFGWRTKSEQELPPEKTLVYLVDPEYPIETIAVRDGGKPCKCRENRNAKKKLLYGVSGMTKGSQKGRKRDDITRVIDGVLYVTPEPSVRNSDEYIPEYELYDSPYERCARQGRNPNLRYIEKYLGPKSLMVKTGASVRCCTKADNENDKEFVKKYSASETAEERWNRAFRDKGLMDFFSRCQDNVPCWLRCAEFSKKGCCCTDDRRLVVKRPVCECKYERKIVKREEEKEKWLRRQTRLKNHKKLPYSQVAGLSRPMRTETNLVISDVKGKSRADDTADDVVEYCVTGVTQSRVMGPAERILSGVGMHTPLTTPESRSKEDLNIKKIHRHWSPMNINTAAFPTAMTVTRADNKHKIDKRSAAAYSEWSKPRKEDRDKNLEKNHAPSEDTDKKIKKLNSASTSVKRSAVSSRSLRGTSGNKSATKMLRENDKRSVHKQKSTGSILSRAEKTVSRDKTEEISSESEKNLLKIELEKMASEGFLFARLPACWQFPQLQWWFMYRKGIALPPEEKKKLMALSLGLWNAAEKQSPKKILASTFQVPQEIMDTWNFDQADKIKREIALKKETFLSSVRKLRVLQARSMWGLMEFGKCPGISFKKAFFTYLPSKESDGFVFKPWENK